MILKIIISYDFVIRVSSVAYINSIPEFSEKKKKKKKKPIRHGPALIV